MFDESRNTHFALKEQFQDFVDFGKDGSIDYERKTHSDAIKTWVLAHGANAYLTALREIHADRPRYGSDPRGRQPMDDTEYQVHIRRAIVFHAMIQQNAEILGDFSVTDGVTGKPPLQLLIEEVIYFEKCHHNKESEKSRNLMSIWLYILRDVSQKNPKALKQLKLNDFYQTQAGLHDGNDDLFFQCSNPRSVPLVYNLLQNTGLKWKLPSFEEYALATGTFITTLLVIAPLILCLAAVLTASVIFREAGAEFAITGYKFVKDMLGDCLQIFSARSAAEPIPLDEMRSEAVIPATINELESIFNMTPSVPSALQTTQFTPMVLSGQGSAPPAPLSLDTSNFSNGGIAPRERPE